MPVSTEYKAFVKDLLSGFGPISMRNMFSGAGVYADGVIFAIIFDDTLYLKADESFSRDFAAEGKGPPSPMSARAARRSPCPIGKCLSACSTTLKNS